MTEKRRFTLYCLIGTLLTIFFVFFIPPFQKPDEASHYWRTLSAVGRLRSLPEFGKTIVYKEEYNLPDLFWSSRIASGSHVKFPINLYQNNNLLNNKEIANEKIIFNNKYFVSYFPQIIGYILGFGYPLVGFFMARLVGALLFLVAIGFALREISKRYLHIVMIFLIIPMVWHQVTAVSYDSFFITTVILLFTFFTKIFVDKQYTKRNYFWFIFLITLISFIKPGNLVFLTLLFLLPFKKIISVFADRQYVILGFLFLTSLVIISLIFIKGNNYELAELSDINVLAQEKILFSDPLAFLSSFYKTLEEKNGFYITSFLGQFGWLDYTFGLWVYLLVFILIVWFYKDMLLRLKRSVLSGWQTFILSIFLGSYIGMVFLGMFLRWTPGGAEVIEGVQGRYFIPLVPFALFFITELTLKIGKKRSEKIIATLSLLTIFLAFLSVTYKRYYDYSSIYQNQGNLSKNYQLLLDEKNTFKTEILDKKIVLEMDTFGNKFSGFELMVEPAKETLIPLSYEIRTTEDKTIQRGYLSADNIQNKVLSEKFSIKNTSDDIVYLELNPLISGNENNYLKLIRKSKDMEGYFGTLLFISK